MSAEPKEAAAETTAAAAASTDAAATGAEGELDATDAELEEMRQKVAEMEEEQKRMTELSGGTASPAYAASKTHPTPEQAADVDSRSIHVAQVDYSVTEEELKKLFEACGAVVRATILKDRFSGQPKGFAYIEFQNADSIQNAMILNDTEFKGRTLKITPKRTNVPGMGRGGGRGGRGGRGRGGPRGGYGGGGGGGYDSGYGGGGGYGPVRGRGRGRGRGGFHPYQY